ncbi:MAG: hypothetical protein E7399_05340, partial [Ruminococcaceae bacterium]|nr:hypothetical protein [Oscillospiraceae bacterium]
MIYAPEYYLKFRCIAEQCRHSCCIGWEIDIDDASYKRYHGVLGEFGKRLKEQIEITDGVAHFKLGEKGRCPFLNERNLCDIILQLGKPCLCQICSEHPRFYNEYDGRRELGLGLCCEEACRLILTEQQPMKLVRIEGEGEELPFFGFRERLFSQLCDRSVPLNQRIKGIGFSLPEHSAEEWKKLFLELEHLNAEWESLLLDLEEAELEFSSEWDIPFEQLLVYFLYRHLGEGVYDGRIEERILFSLLGLHFIQLLCANHAKRKGSVTLDDFLEYARMYSTEIEYSEEN